MIRQAVILAGGKGKRMKKGTSDPELLSTPKQLLSVNGIPIIERNLKRLIENGLEVAIVVNQETQSIFREALKSYNVKYILQDEALGTAHALNLARDFIKDDLFLVLMGDDIVEYDDHVLETAKSPTLFVYEVDNLDGYGAVMLDEKGKVVEIREKELTGPGLVNPGMYILPKSFFDMYDKIPVNPKTNERYLTEVIRLFRESGNPFDTQKLSLWMGVNTPEELKIARERLKK